MIAFWIVLILLILFVLILFLIAYLAVNYALIPGSGAEKREVLSDEAEAFDPGEGVHVDYKEEKEKGIAWLNSMQEVVEDVQIKTPDDKILRGHIFKQSTYTDKWAIILHGYQSDELLSFKHADQFYKNGMNVLTYELRAHGDSDGKYIGMGVLDKDDLILWTNYIVNQDNDAKIAIHGTSMGAATVLMASGMENLPSQVYAIVDDCGYSSVREIFALELKKRFNISSKLLMEVFSLVCKFRAGYSLEEGEVSKYLIHNNVPTLVIHGEEDDFVPIEMSMRNFENIRHEDKEFIRVKTAVHAQSHFVDEEKYYDSIFMFLEKYF